MTATAPYVRLGESGLKVSVPILGCMTYGSKKWAEWALEEEEALPIMKAAWDRGINTFDTANAYGNGESEKIIATFIEKYNIPRNQLLILTKCYALVSQNISDKTYIMPHLQKEPRYVNQAGLSRQAIFNAVDASLARLKTSYIDLYQIHRYDPNSPAEETMKALHDLVQSGKVRYIGASSMRAWQFAHYQHVAEKNGWTKFVSIQSEYSLLYREDEREMIPYSAFTGVGIIPWGPVNGGNLTRPVGNITARHVDNDNTFGERKFSDAEKLIISRVEEIAKKRDKTMAQIALAWVQDRVSSLIVGLSSVERIDASILGSFTLTEEEKKYLEEPYVPVPVRGHA